jgi:hypothetical protein
MFFPPDCPSGLIILLQAMCSGVAVIDCCCSSFGVEFSWRLDANAFDVNLRKLYAISIPNALKRMVVLLQGIRLGIS